MDCKSKDYFNGIFVSQLKFRIPTLGLNIFVIWWLYII